MAKTADLPGVTVCLVENQLAVSAPVDNASLELLYEEHDADQGVGDWRLGEDGEDLRLQYSGTQR